MSALAILRANALYLYYSDKNTPSGGTLPLTAVSDMDVVSEEELTRAITKMIPASLHSPSSTLLVLGEELCFAQLLAGISKEEAEKRLVTMTPFTHVTTAMYPRQKEQVIVATNQDLYESVARSLASTGHPVALVVPWGYVVELGISKGEVDAVTVKHAFDAINSLRSGAFPLKVEHAQSLPTSAPNVTKQARKVSWGWIGFGVGSLLYAFFMYWFFMRS